MTTPSHSQKTVDKPIAKQDEKQVLVSVRGVDKVFTKGDEKVYALRDINLDVYQAEYLSIMGPSGSGKSTLFNMVGALDKPTAGQVTVGGVSLPTLGSRELSYFRCKHIGYVFQTYNLIPWLSALGNVMLPLTFLGKDDATAEKRAKHVLDIVGLGHRLDHTPGECSGGQQQRIAIARALANEPAIILADEPTANLDQKTGEEIIILLSQLCKDEGVTVITATHDYKMLAASDRIVWIKDGRVDKIENAEDMDINVGSITVDQPKK
ncbi:MAG: ABC transporter ATP-binding protein [Kiritimatiellia bacterium]|jgi:putative ABC transport system ATP-binding protein|uniref:ABC transporter ATP-binding protein n=1 Tax=Atribacter sp. TaxID=2847780 RepID=UPI003D986EC9